MKLNHRKYLKYKTFLLAVGTLCVTSCSDDFLDVPPARNNSVEVFFQTPEQFNQAVLGVYNGLQDLTVSNYWNLSEVRSDNTLEQVTSAQRDWSEIGNFTLSSQTSTLQGSWNTSYNIIYRANEVIRQLEGFEDFEAKQQYSAEAHFLRALSYFDLVRFFGPVPYIDRVITGREGGEIPRSSREDIYALIVEDLKLAAENLPPQYTTADKGRATKWAAKALLGRVYLTMAGYPLNQKDKLELAREAFADVIAQEGTFVNWSTNFKDLFLSSNDNAYHIFEIQYVAGGLGLGNQLPSEMAPSLPPEWAQWGSFGNNVWPTTELVALYEENDLRRVATLDTGYVDEQGFEYNNPIFTKFLEKGNREPLDRYDWPINFPVIRYADVLLMYAEVLNELSGPTQEAVDILNRIRNRAQLAPVQPASQEELRLAIQEERRREFAGEGLRWHDIVRTGKAVDVMNNFFQTNAINKTIDETQLIYPIPFNEMNINPGLYTQNPGYN